MNNYVWNLNDFNLKVNPPSFNDFLKDEMEFNSEKIKKINHIIQRKEFKLEIKESDLHKDVIDNFMWWVHIINNQNIENSNKFDKVVIRKLTKLYPYKSKKKRIVKKWWKNHSELVELNDVAIDMEMK